ncbi:MAG TPA: DUF4864 domain-containing protein [Ramlibacter sp.]|nr:DUF4864 domain-containing protein [Ramlibacter sp.]
MHSLPVFVFESSPPMRDRRSWRSTAVSWTLLLSAALLAAVYASDPPQPTPSRAAASQVVQQVVQQQLQALASQDAMQAFALADTNMRTQFGTADAFLTTVREQYPMLMHPSSVLFLKPQTHGTIAMQKVRMSDEGGAAWTLTYLLNRQQDNQWRISGCLVTPEGRQVIV